MYNANNTATGAVLQPVISNTNANCEKVYTSSHQLTRVKGGSVFYDTPEVSTLEAPSSGHKREFIFHHFIYMGAESYLELENTAPKAPLDLLVSVTPTSKFIDV